MIVLVIIAALAAIAAPALMGTGPKGKATSDLAMVRQMQSSVDRFVLEYGAVPAAWSATSGNNKVLTGAEVTAMVEMLTGTYGGTDPAKAHSLQNPTLQNTDDVSNFSSRMTAMVTNVGAGGPGNFRVVILQYRKSDTGLVVDGDGSVSNTLLPASTALSSPFFDETVNTAWTTAGKAAWPY
jgi:type II secretory pathway pseudopilin PulG